MNEVSIMRLRPESSHLVPALLGMFGAAFEDVPEWTNRRPDANYLTRLLAQDHIFVLAALEQDKVVGGLVAYELAKIEQPRSEVYIYDLAVDAAHRRQGIATALIDALQPLARQCGAWVIYVQADYGDEPAIALYTKLGPREDVMHFDLPVRKLDKNGL